MPEQELCSFARVRPHPLSIPNLVPKCLLICFAAISSNALAAGFYTGPVVYQQALATATTGVFYALINGVVGQTPPACATQTGRFAVNSTTDAGKAQIAIVLSALARGATVWIQGSGACDVWPDTETVLLVYSN